MNTQKQNKTTRARWGAAIVAITPVVLLAGFVYHPFIEALPDAAAVAAGIAADTTLWGFSHLVTGIASGLMILTFLAIRSYLRQAGEERWSAPAVPFIVLGSTLFALLPAMEIGILGAFEAGADVELAQTAIDPWFRPIFLTGSILFALGALGFAIAIARSGLLRSRLTWLVVGALVVMALARIVPLGVVQFYVGPAAGIVALWPLAYQMWRHSASRVAAQQRPIPAT